MNKKTRLSNKDKLEIKTYYAECQNIRETARYFKDKWSYYAVRNVIHEDNEADQLISQKKEEYTKSTLEHMEEQHETKKRVIDKLLKSIELKADDIKHIDKMNIKDLATAYGIILDKELKVLELKQKREEDEEDLQKVKDILVTIKEVANNDR